MLLTVRSSRRSNPQTVSLLGRCSARMGKCWRVWFTPYEMGHSGISIPVSRGESAAQLWKILPGKDPTLRAILQPGRWYRNLEDYFGYQAAWFTPDSRRLVTASGDGQIQLWDTDLGQLLHTLPGRDPFLSPRWPASCGVTGKRPGAWLGYFSRVGPGKYLDDLRFQRQPIFLAVYYPGERTDCRFYQGVARGAGIRQHHSRRTNSSNFPAAQLRTQYPPARTEHFWPTASPAN